MNLLMKKDILTEAEAKQRAKDISDVEYTFSVALPKGDQFYGHLEINFNAATTKTFLEFTGTMVTQLKVNGKEQKAEVQSNRINIETK